MSYEFVQAEPQSSRDDIVRFFWDQRHWPWPTLEEYYRAWDWRYSSLSDGREWVWLAREKASGEIVGHIAVYLRRFRIGSTELRVGVPGNLVVREECRGSLAGPRLVSFPRTLVKSGELDAILAFANPTAHGMFERLGFRDFGLMHPFVRVVRWGAVLRRRVPAISPIGSIVDAMTLAKRQSTDVRKAKHGKRLQVRVLSPDEFLAFDRSHWRIPSDRLATDDTGGYVVRRYLECPHAVRRLVGLIDVERQTLEAYVVAGGAERIRIWDCQVNEDSIDESAAISRAAGALSDAETIVVPVLPGSGLAKKLTGAGFRHRQPDDYMNQTTRVSAFWLDGHPAGEALADVDKWNLWFGSNHY